MRAPAHPSYRGEALPDGLLQSDVRSEAFNEGSANGLAPDGNAWLEGKKNSPKIAEHELLGAG